MAMLSEITLYITLYITLKYIKMYNSFNSQTFDSTPPLQIQDGSSLSLPSQKDIPKQL